MEDSRLVPEEKFTFRVKCRLSQNITLRDVSALKKVGEFLTDLSSLTKIPETEMALLRGFPPKRIYYEHSMTLQSLGLVNQDTIIVELDKSGNPGGSPDSETVSATLPSSTATTSLLTSVSSNSTSKADSNPAPKSEGPATSTNSTKPKVADSENRKPDSSNKGSSGSGALRTPHVPVNHHIDTLSSSTPGVPLGSVGVIMRKVIPSDNSCLFSAITFCRTGIENTSSIELRGLIAKTVTEDPTVYNDGFLGRSNKDYVDWISRLDSWGGGIELAILSAHFELQINVMDTQHLRINRFGEDQEYTSCIFLIYDGIHYDALYLESYDGSRIITIFPVEDTSIFDQVMDVGREAHLSHQYTDVNNCKMRCEICNTGFRNSEEATQHAKTTGHNAFAEIQ